MSTNYQNNSSMDHVICLLRNAGLAFDENLHNVAFNNDTMTKNTTYASTFSSLKKTVILIF